jgi:hemolysin activation/secretion protein
VNDRNGRRYSGARRVGLLAGALVLVLSGTAPAQTPPPLPGGIGRLDLPIAPAAAPQALPPMPVPAPPPAAPVAPGGPTFTIKDIVIEGATVYKPEELRPEVEKYIGKTVTFEAVPEIEEAIARHYRRDGYILARALAPEGQTLDPEAAVLHIQVFEGYIDKVRLDPLEYEVGDRGTLVRSILKKIEHACRWGDEPVGDKPCPLHKNVLERYLLLANDLPGVKASAVIQPAPEASGGADLFVTISETRYSAFAKLDNRGSVYTGPFRFDTGASVNNLTDFYERTSPRLIVAAPSDELVIGDITEEIPLTSEGTRAALGLTKSNSRPGDVLRAQDIRSHTDSYTLSVIHPVWRSRSENFFARVGFEYRDSLTKIAADTVFFDDRTRTVTIGGTYDLADGYYGVNLLDLRFVKGLPIAGASREDSRRPRSNALATGDFSKLQFETSRLQRLYPEVSLLGSITGQYSFSNLLVGDQFGIGGERYLRAYDASEVLGDHGVAAKLELQYNPDWAGEVLEYVGAPYEALRALQFYAYYDFGMVWQRASEEALTEVGSTARDRDSAAAAGGGVRFNIYDWVNGYVEVAKPLTRDLQAERAKGESGKDLRYFFTLSAQF